MPTLLSRSAWAKISVFRKKWPFSPSKRSYIGLFGSNWKSAPQNWPLCQISAPLDKRELEFDLERYQNMAWWRHTYLLAMTSAKFLWLLRDFIPEYHHAKFGCNWTTNKVETGGGGAQCASQPIWFQKTQVWIGLKHATMKWSLKILVFNNHFEIITTRWKSSPHQPYQARGGGAEMPGWPTHSCQSETSYPMMPKLGDFSFYP